MKKNIINYTPFFTEGTDTEYSALWARRGIWKAKWITASLEQEPNLFAYRNHFNIDLEQDVRIHVSADAFYILYLDGVEISRGPELGTPERYCFDTFDLKLSSGSHGFSVLVWNPGKFTPFFKISSGNSFILAAEGELSSILDTNKKNWQGKILPGVNITQCALGTVFPQVYIDHRLFPADTESGGGEDWNSVTELYNGRKSLPGIEYKAQRFMTPSMLPDLVSLPIKGFKVVYVSAQLSNFYDEKEMLTDEIEYWQKGLCSLPITVQPHTKRKILLYLDNYYCGYPAIQCSQGRDSVISVKWAEALHLVDDPNSWEKGKRDLFLNHYIHGNVDKMRCGGKENERFIALGYRSGCFIELSIDTRDEVLRITDFTLFESRYPLEQEVTFQVSDEGLNACLATTFRTLQMCMHDTYIDCPYYEQLMYLGDARLQMLLNYVVSTDYRLAEKSIRLMASGRAGDGLLLSRYPSSVALCIPPFSMLFAGIVNDYVRYVADRDTLREILPRLHESMESLEKYVREDGLIAFPDSWNFVDWPEDWKGSFNFRSGNPPEGPDNISGVVNWTYAYALGQAAELHDSIGEHEYAARYRRLGMSLTGKMIDTFYRPDEKLFSDLSSTVLYSEHSQCLALLSGFLPPDIERQVSNALFESKVKMTKMTVYFSFYYMEACYKFKRFDAFMERMKLWFDIKKYNMRTVPESPEPSRSDCHAWSSHPLYHFFASIFGIRPGSAGFKTVKLEPLPGKLENGKIAVPHSNGIIEVSFQKNSCGNQDWDIILPEGLEGQFILGETTKNLCPGINHIESGLK